MRIAGIIAEYNPFHNGHAWHIARTREAGYDGVIVCMGGHFTQRGEPAMLSKWDRARMALACGADAVFELPALFAVRTADAFARGGVAILGGLGADALSFGSEIDDMALLQKRLAALRERGARSRVRCDRPEAGRGHVPRPGLGRGGGGIPGRPGGGPEPPQCRAGRGIPCGAGRPAAPP